MFNIHACKYRDRHVWFTMVSVKALSEQERMGYPYSLWVKLIIFNCQNLKLFKSRKKYDIFYILIILRFGFHSESTSWNGGLLNGPFALICSLYMINFDGYFVYPSVVFVIKYLQLKNCWRSMMPARILLQMNLKKVC